jgi:A/G-specific adenine glycosylase
MLMILRDDGRVLLQRRPPSGIWGGLWSFPQLEKPLTRAAAKKWARLQLGLEIRAGTPWPDFEHQFSHYTLKITPLPAKLLGTSGACMEESGTVWYNPNHASDRGLATPVQRLLNELRKSKWHEQ